MSSIFYGDYEMHSLTKRFFNMPVLLLVGLFLVGVAITVIPHSDIGKYTVAGETFRLPSRYGSPFSDNALDFFPLLADINVTPIRNSSIYNHYDEIHVYVSTYGMNNSAGLQQIPNDLVADNPDSKTGNDRIVYIGDQKFIPILNNKVINSNVKKAPDPGQFWSYFYSKPDKKYFHCDNLARAGLLSRCDVRFAFDDKLAIHINFSKKHLADASLIIEGVTQLLLKAKQTGDRR